MWLKPKDCIQAPTFGKWGLGGSLLPLTKKILCQLHRVFSLNFWWGDSKFSVPIGPWQGRSRMGGGDLQKKSDWSQNCPINAKLGHFIAFYSTFELKSSQIWHKNVFKFFKFSGTNLGWGGTSLGPKTGTSVGWGGDWQNFRRMGGTPQSLQEKTLLQSVAIGIYSFSAHLPKSHFNFKMAIAWVRALHSSMHLKISKGTPQWPSCIKL